MSSRPTLAWSCHAGCGREATTRAPVGISSVAEQHLAHLGVRVRRSKAKYGIPVLVRHIGRHAGVQKPLDCDHIAVSDSSGQGNGIVRHGANCAGESPGSLLDSATGRLGEGPGRPLLGPSRCPNRSHKDCAPSDRSRTCTRTRPPLPSERGAASCCYCRAEGGGVSCPVRPVRSLPARLRRPAVRQSSAACRSRPCTPGSTSTVGVAPRICLPRPLP